MKYIIKSGFGIALVVLLMLVSCDPNEFDKSDLEFSSAPTAEEMSFTMTQGDDVYHYNLENETQLSGINTIKWNFGNGGTGEGNSVTAYFPLPGTYEVSLTITAADGSFGVKTLTVEQTETDYAFLDSPVLTMISGGVSLLEGKTWVVDSLETAHYGLGPVGGNWTEWWAATPLQKTGGGAYDDEFTFKLVDFVFDYANNGTSYVLAFRLDDPNYSNPVPVDGDADSRVEFTPTVANWALNERDGVNYISLSSDKPSFFGIDFGAVNNEYRIESVTEYNMTLSCIGGDGNRWYTTLVLKGYVKPTVTYSVSVEAGTGPNAYVVSLADVVIPAGNSVSGYTVDFGDGSVVMEEGDYTASIEHTYMRKGAYNVKVVVMSSAGDFTASQIVDIAEHHPDYVEFILDEMVMYNDFSEIELAPVLGENCAVNIVDNPDAIYPNRSSKVAFYSKENNEWANANLKLSAGFRFDLRLQSAFKLKVYGKAGDAVLLKLENTDRGGNAWQTGVELTYTIQADDTWEVVEYDFAGVGAGFDWTGDIFTGDVTTDDNFNHDFYNIIRIMLNPGVGTGVHEFYFDELAGPHVEGIKSGRLN